MGLLDNDNWDWDEIDTEMPTLGLLLDEKALRLYWTTKEGKQIFIEDMTTEHIENICRAGIDGRLAMDEKTEDRFLLELSIRKERS